MWRLRLLGDISLSFGERKIRRLRASKYAFLLAYLSIHPDRAFSREELVEVFWPEGDLEGGRLCLRTALASLRRQLEEPHLFLEGARDLVRLNGERICTDVAEFEEAVQRGEAGGRVLYGGEFLPGCYDDWAILERLRLEALFSTMLGGVVEEVGVGEPKERAKASALPLPASRFFGRREELDELAGIVAEHRLVSLVGLGGMGKTRLAIEAGRSLESCGRVFFVAAASSSEVFQLSNVTAESLGVAKQPIESLEERLDACLQAEPTVLILDNFEQLADTATATEWVERRLNHCRTLKVLVTSRIPLNLDGERLVAVGPMRLEDAQEMFMDRARAVLPDFPRYERLDELCLQLDKIPLAIVLCAARANVLTGSAMLRGLDRKFEVLQSVKPGKEGRQNSLMTVLDWACPTQNDLHDSLCALTVFRSGWTFEAATAILGANALELLTGLRQRSLIGLKTGVEQHRFTMLDAVRDYAVQTADPSVIRAAAVRHSEYYCRLSHEIAGLHAIDEWGSFRALDIESANIFAAFETGLKLDAKRQLETLDAIQFARWCLWVRGYGCSLVNIYNIAESLLNGSLGLARGWLLRFGAEAAGNRLEYGLAIDRLEEAEGLFLELGSIGPASSAMQLAAHYYELAGDLDGAIRCIERQVRIIPREDEQARSIALAGLAHMYLNPDGNLERAREIYLDLERYWTGKVGGDGHLAVIGQGLAACHSAQGEFERASALLKGSIETFRKLGETQREAEAWRKLAEVYASSGDHDQSRSAYSQSERLRNP